MSDYTNYDHCVIYANGDIKCYHPETKIIEGFEGIVQVPQTNPKLTQERCYQICENCRQCRIKHNEKQYKCQSCSNCDVCSGIIVSKYNENRSYPDINYRIF
jgi:hypothetical protein